MRQSDLNAADLDRPLCEVVWNGWMESNRPNRFDLDFCDV